MNPGPARILECPYCGEEKKVLSLISGNTFGGCQWSDTKREYPMLPEVSAVQKCPKCGKYYLIGRCKEKESKPDDWSFELGNLTYRELKEAYTQLVGDVIKGQSSEELAESETQTVLFLLLFAYNDKFNRDGIMTDTPQVERDYIVQKVRLILSRIPNKQENTAIRAELLREIGDFDGCISLLTEYHPSDEFFVSLKDQIAKKAKEKDTKAFKL